MPAHKKTFYQFEQEDTNVSKLQKKILDKMGYKQPDGSDSANIKAWEAQQAWALARALALLNSYAKNPDIIADVERKEKQRGNKQHPREMICEKAIKLIDDIFNPRKQVGPFKVDLLPTFIFGNRQQFFEVFTDELIARQDPKNAHFTEDHLVKAANAIGPGKAASVANSLQDAVPNIVARIALNHPRVDRNGAKQKYLTYHSLGHAMEMAEDARKALRSVANEIFPGDANLQKIYIELAAAAAAAHDIIQDLGAPSNEIESKRIYDQIMRETLAEHLNPTDPNYRMMMQFVERFSSQVIVCGTVFNVFAGKPIIDDINAASKTHGMDQVDRAILAASLAIGKNDTRRMEMVGKDYVEQHAELLEQLYQGIGGEKNSFVSFLKDKGVDPHTADGLPNLDFHRYLHCIGQNMRMGGVEVTRAGGMQNPEFSLFFGDLQREMREINSKCTLNTKGEGAEAILRRLIAKNIGKEPTDLGDAEFSSEVRKFYADLIKVLKAEQGFAAGLSEKNMAEAIEAYNALLPPDQHITKPPGDGWATYAQQLKGYIDHLESSFNHSKDPQAFMQGIILDMAQVGSKQMGKSLYSTAGNSAPYVRALEEQAWEMTAALAPILDKFQAELSTMFDAKETLHRREAQLVSFDLRNIDPLKAMMGDAEKKIAELEGKLKAEPDNAELQTQMEEAQKNLELCKSDLEAALASPERQQLIQLQSDSKAALTSARDGLNQKLSSISGTNFHHDSDISIKLMELVERYPGFSGEIQVAPSSYDASEQTYYLDADGLCGLHQRMQDNQQEIHLIKAQASSLRQGEAMRRQSAVHASESKTEAPSPAKSPAEQRAALRELQEEALKNATPPNSAQEARRQDQIPTGNQRMK